MNTQTMTERRPWARMGVELPRRMISLVRNRVEVPRTEDVLLNRWAVCEVQERHKLSVDVAASDDALEAVAPALRECLKNAPPKLRKRVLAAVQVTHRNVARLSLEARP